MKWTNVINWYYRNTGQVTVIGLSKPLQKQGFSSVQFSSVAQSCPTLCYPMNHSTPGLPVHHQLLEFTQTCVDRVRDAIQPSHPRSSPSPPAPNPSQHSFCFPAVRGDRRPPLGSKPTPRLTSAFSPQPPLPLIWPEGCLWPWVPRTGG